MRRGLRERKLLDGPGVARRVIHSSPCRDVERVSEVSARKVKISEYFSEGREKE